MDSGETSKYPIISCENNTAYQGGIGLSLSDTITVNKMANSVKPIMGAPNVTIAAWCFALGVSTFGPNQSVQMSFDEIQLTHARQGHTIHNTQVFSKNGEWIVYDTRNDDTQIGSTGSVEMVNAASGEVRVLYRTAHQTRYGPGVGAATFSPRRDRVLFIHGIRNADASRPYGMTRRTGVAIDIDRPNEPVFMDARDITPPFTKGALRGGTHAHSWSGDGQWISFTYNDYVMERLAESDTTVRDLRMVGVMVPGGVAVSPNTSLENNSGECFSVVVTDVTEHPAPGSDEIDRAFDECWVGTDGYLKPDGRRQSRALAFQGDVRDTAGNVVTEIFVIDLPSDITQAAPGRPLEGTTTTRPGVPVGVSQRRITFSERGVEGPRHWLRTTPDGELICFLAKDAKGVVQLFGVSPNGGERRQITRNDFPVQGPFNIDPDGEWVAYPADNSVFVTRFETGETHRVTRRFSDAEKPVGAPNWSPDGDAIAYNRYVGKGQNRFLQVFLLRKSGYSI
jgi:Periplasmic component of the Tol biopolymer transport system